VKRILQFFRNIRFYRMSLRVKMMGAFIGIVLVPTIALVMLSNTMLADSIRNSYTHKGQDTVERTVNYTFVELSEQLGNYIAFLAVDATFTRAAYYLNEIDSDADMRVLGKESQRRLVLSFLEVTGRNGKVTYSTLPGRKKINMLRSKIIQAVRRGGTPIIDVSYDSDLKEMVLHTAAMIHWQDGEVGYLHGGYILNDAFLRSIVGEQTILAAYFHDADILRSTHKLPLAQAALDAADRHLLLFCKPNITGTKPCKEYGYHTWDFVADDKPYLMVAGLLSVGSKKAMGLLIAAEDASVMYADKERSRQAIFGFGAIFALLGAVLGYFVSGAIVRPVDRLTTELARMADTDQLTGMLNRRSIERIFSIEASRSLRGKISFAVMILDIDYFKKVNDNHGHPVGDEVLKHVASICRDTLRETDYCFRFGGEEFLLFLPLEYSKPVNDIEKFGRASALNAAGRLRQMIKEKSVTVSGIHLDLTVSIGVAIYPEHGKNYEPLLKCADRALYQAKHDGRDRVVMYDDNLASLDGAIVK